MHVKNREFKEFYSKFDWWDVYSSEKTGMEIDFIYNQIENYKIKKKKTNLFIPKEPYVLLKKNL